MKEIFVDTNVLVRFYLPDNPVQNRKAMSLMERCKAGKIALVTGPPVFFEAAWVLRKVHKEPLEEVLNFFESMLTVPLLRILDWDLVLQAIDLARANGIEYADAYISATALKIGVHEVATFDKKDFKKAGMALLEF